MIRKALWILVTLLLVFSEGYCATSTSLSLDLGVHTPVNAALRSAIIPGWGQYFNGQETKGYIVVSGFVLTALTSYLFYSKANNTYDDYKAQGLKNGSLYSDYETQSNQAMIASFFAAGVWIYGVTDAYVTGKSFTINPYTKTDGIRIASKGSDMLLVYNKRF
jgi:hypothetical protein